ncbi:phosphoglycerate kinase [bacterium]|nr:phosphoglycerate kinase [bacterium]NIO18660.1 phosphoglycerate kinase [bacterium]NIO73691.1 phosphoglycerate kinase [bacterium]
MEKLTISDLEIEGKKVLIRCDFNVPLDDKGRITDDTRIQAALPTIRYALGRECAVILMSHMGRPKGKVDPKLSLKPVAQRLGELLNLEVLMAPDCVGPEVEKMAGELKGGEVLLLENLRFHSGEEKNDETFAKQLASLADVFVQDAFGTVHRAHASTSGVPRHLPSGAGFLLQKEIKYLKQALEEPERPFLAILGGAKISTKIGVIKNLLPKVDSLILGGAMAYTFLRAENIETGNSMVEEDKIDTAGEILKQASKKKVTVLLPIDHVITNKVSEDAESKEISEVTIPQGWIGVDIGSFSIKRFSSAVSSSRTILWNGPMGIFEIDKFSNGTKAIAEAIAEATKKGSISIVGGGDSVAAVTKSGLQENVSHISTGGGAALEFLEGKELPGIVALKDK